MMSSGKNLIVSERIRTGRQQAAGILFADLCIFGKGLSSLLGVAWLYNNGFWLLGLAGISSSVYFGLLMKPRIETSKEWFQIVAKDRVTKILWILSLVVIVIDILYLGLAL